MRDDREKVEILKWLLDQIKRAENHKRQLDERLRRINLDRAMPVGGIGYDPMPRSSGTGDGAASIVLKLADIEDRIYEQKKEIEKAIVRVMDILDYLPVNSLEREICELRFIDLKKWDAIEAEIPMSHTQCNKVFNDALNKLLGFPRIRKMVDNARDEYLAYTVARESREIDRKRKKKRSRKSPN